MNQRSKRIEEICKKYDRSDYPGIAVAVVDKGEVIFKKGYGLANLEYDIPIDETTVFHGCSMTKQFTAACIALLMEEGKLSLNQEVSNLLSEFKECNLKLTVSDLLYMVNGLPDAYDTANFLCGIREDEGITKDEFWRNIKAANWCTFSPRTKWSYGNTGYFLLGQIVEAVSGVSLSQFADEHIFKPLGMNHSFIRDDHTKIIKNRAIGYSNYYQLHYNDREPRYTTKDDTLSINAENVEIGGAGQLWTTVNDLLKWNDNFYENKLGKCSAEFTRFLTTSGKLDNGQDCHYGCGLFIDDFHGQKIVHHGGWAGGFSAYDTFLPEIKSAVIILGNHTDFMYEFGYQSGGITEQILNVLIGKENGKNDLGKDDKTSSTAEQTSENGMPPITRTILEQSQLECYIGEYRCDSLKVTYAVTTENGKLFVRNDNLHNTAVDFYYTYTENDTFISDWNKQTESQFITFCHDDQGDISSFVFRGDSDSMKERFVFKKILNN